MIVKQIKSFHCLSIVPKSIPNKKHYTSSTVKEVTKLNENKNAAQRYFPTNKKIWRNKSRKQINFHWLHTSRYVGLRYQSDFVYYKIVSTSRNKKYCAIKVFNNIIQFEHNLRFIKFITIWKKFKLWYQQNVKWFY